LVYYAVVLYPYSFFIFQNNPLHISLFNRPPTEALEFEFLLSSALDIFQARLPHKPADQDFGLLHAVDERLAMYGWLTNTGVKFVVIVDMEGRVATNLDSKVAMSVGLRDADLKPVSLDFVLCFPIRPPLVDVSSARIRLVCFCFQSHISQAFRALQTAYISLLRNPFYDPDAHTPSAAQAEQRVGSTQITSRKFISEVKRIGEAWVPGLTSI